jgi:hypothetical protein
VSGGCFVFLFVVVSSFFDLSSVLFLLLCLRLRSVICERDTIFVDRRTAFSLQISVFRLQTEGQRASKTAMARKMERATTKDRYGSQDRKNDHETFYQRPQMERRAVT